MPRAPYRLCSSPYRPFPACGNLVAVWRSCMPYAFLLQEHLFCQTPFRDAIPCCGFWSRIPWLKSGTLPSKAAALCRSSAFWDLLWLGSGIMPLAAAALWRGWPCLTPWHRLGGGAFFRCSSLTTLTIPESVTCIKDSTFGGCSSLRSLTIPASVTSIGNHAFAGCSSLPRLDIQNGVAEIGYNAFFGCSSLTTLTIPESVTCIKGDTFGECSASRSLTIPASVTSIGRYAFAGCSSLTRLDIPNGVAKIGYNAFFSCSSLTTLTIPESVTCIKDDTFGECSALRSLTIPASVTSIGRYAFAGCSSLTRLDIPSSVTSLTIPETVREIGSNDKKRRPTRRGRGGRRSRAVNEVEDAAVLWMCWKMLEPKALEVDGFYLNMHDLGRAHGEATWSKHSCQK